MGKWRERLRCHVTGAGDEKPEPPARASRPAKGVPAAVGRDLRGDMAAPSSTSGPATRGGQSRAPETDGEGARDWKKAIVISGGGMAGLATAVAFKSYKIPFVLVERAQSLRDDEGTAIALWNNAWVALDALGAGDKLREKHLPLEKVEICNTGRVMQTSHTSDNIRNEFRGVRRGEIASALASKLDEGDVVYGNVAFLTHKQMASLLTDSNPIFLILFFSFCRERGCACRNDTQRGTGDLQRRNSD